jgi:hypothetical protein
MKAFLITPDTKSIQGIEIQGPDDIKSLIGFDSIESDAVGEGGDRLYFDEECFIRGSTGRFQIDSLVPVAGKGVLIGTTENGGMLQDVRTSIEDLRQRTKFQ